MIYCKSCNKLFTKYSITSKEVVVVRRDFNFIYHEDSEFIDAILENERIEDVQDVKSSSILCPNCEGRIDEEYYDIIRNNAECIPIFNFFNKFANKRGEINLNKLKANELLQAKKYLDKLNELN